MWSGNTWYGTAVADDMTWTPPGRGTAYHPHTEVRGSATPEAHAAAVARTGEADPYPLDLGFGTDHDPRASPYTYREFACPTAGNGFYAAGVQHIGSEALGHRAAPAGQAWRVPNVGRGGAVDRTAYESRFSTGTPCIEDGPTGLATSELTGEPLADYYNVRGRDSADVEGDEKCQPGRWDVSANNGQGAWVADPTVPGYYSSPDVPGGPGAQYNLRYSGDGAANMEGHAREDMTRPAAYLVRDGDSWITVHLGNEWPLGNFARRPDVLVGLAGMVSLDIDRRSMGWRRSPWRLRDPWTRVSNQESYSGIGAGWCADGNPACDPTQAPEDWASIYVHGPSRWFGAFTIGGTGGCTMPDHVWRDRQLNVMSPDQVIVCLLPTGSNRRCS